MANEIGPFNLAFGSPYPTNIGPMLLVYNQKTFSTMHHYNYNRHIASIALHLALESFLLTATLSVEPFGTQSSSKFQHSTFLAKNWLT